MNQKEFLDIVLPIKDNLYRLARRFLTSSDEAEDDDDYVQLGKTGIYHPVVKEKEGEVA